MSEIPKRTAPSSLSMPRARRNASPDCRMIERASSTSRAPAAVSVTPVWERSNSTTPCSASKPDTCLTSAGVEMRSFAAARENVPSSAAAMMPSSLLSYIVPPRAPPHPPKRGMRQPFVTTRKPKVVTILTNVEFPWATPRTSMA